MGDDERELFEQAMRGVTAHRSQRARPQRTAPHPHPAQTERDAEAVLATLLTAPDTLDDVETGEELLFARAGLSRATLRKLRRGEFVVESCVDLHGMTRDKAFVYLVAFIAEARQLGHRCVRVVHGKGLRSPGKQPVLKFLVGRWLRKRDEILAFCPARPADGGTGAIYVLLRKH